jgi:hypothetical protein
MSEALGTTATAADSPSPRGPLTDAGGAPPRTGVIPDNACTAP